MCCVYVLVCGTSRKVLSSGMGVMGIGWRTRNAALCISWYLCYVMLCYVMTMYGVVWGTNGCLELRVTENLECYGGAFRLFGALLFVVCCLFFVVCCLFFTFLIYCVYFLFYYLFYYILLFLCFVFYGGIKLS
jgi:hypothetical protein